MDSDPNPYESPQVSWDKAETDDELDRVAVVAGRSLSETKPWVLFISVLGFILSGLFAVVFFFSALVGGGLVTLVLVVPLGLLFYFVPSLLLWRYAQRIAGFQQDHTTDSFADAIAAQKSFWKYLGILLIVVLGFYAVAIVFALAANVASNF